MVVLCRRSCLQALVVPVTPCRAQRAAEYACNDASEAHATPLTVSRRQFACADLVNHETVDRRVPAPRAPACGDRAQATLDERHRRESGGCLVLPSDLDDRCVYGLAVAPAIRQVWYGCQRACHPNNIDTFVQY